MTERLTARSSRGVPDEVLAHLRRRSTPVAVNRAPRPGRSYGGTRFRGLPPSEAEDLVPGVGMPITMLVDRRGGSCGHEVGDDDDGPTRSSAARWPSSPRTSGRPRPGPLARSYVPQAGGAAWRCTSSRLVTARLPASRCRLRTAAWSKAGLSPAAQPVRAERRRQVPRGERPTVAWARAPPLDRISKQVEPDTGQSGPSGRAADGHTFGRSPRVARSATLTPMRHQPLRSADN